MAQIPIKTRNYSRLLVTLDRIPPNVCRMFAVRMWHGREAKTIKRLKLHELVKRSGISSRNFQRIGTMDTWAEVKVGVAARFASACGVDLLHKRPFERFMNKLYRSGLPYFTKKQREFFDKVIQKYESETAAEIHQP